MAARKWAAVTPAGTLAVTGPPEKRFPLANRAIGGSVCTAVLSRLFACVTFRWDRTRTRRVLSIVDILIELFLPTHAAQRPDRGTRIQES